MGDFGWPEDESVVKRRVVCGVKTLHENDRFNLGLILGDNVYLEGTQIDDYDRLDRVFAQSFPATTFPFDFLAILGNHDHMEDVYTQSLYHLIREPRFYMPSRYYFYDVFLGDETSIRFICVDSTPFFEFDFENPSFDIEDELEDLKQFLEGAVQYDYVFILLHHHINDGCGPHRYVPHGNPLIEWIRQSRATAVINGHNHNMQYFGPERYRPAIFTVGNSAWVDDVTRAAGTNEWCASPSIGGFGQLIITKLCATFNFIDADGNILHTVTISRF